MCQSYEAQLQRAASTFIYLISYGYNLLSNVFD